MAQAEFFANYWKPFAPTDSRWAPNKYISLMLILAMTVLFGGWQVGIFISQNVSAVAVVNSIGPLDFDVDGAGWSTPGTALTTTLMNSGTIGNANHGGWTKTGVGLTTEAHKTGCSNLSTFSVDGTSFAAARSSNSFGVDNTGVLRYMSASVPSSGQVGYTRLVAMSCITVNMASIGGTGVIDAIRMNGNLSGNVIAQFSYATKCSGLGGSLGVNLETIGGSTSNTSCVALTNTNAYWFTLSWDSVAQSCRLDIADTTGAVVSGSPLSTSAGNCATGDIASVDFGNRESGTSPSGQNFFENTMVRFSGKPPILNPLNTVQDSVYWVAQAHGFHGSGTVTSIATSKALEEHSGDIVNTACTHETVSPATSVTNTATETFTKNTGSESNANGQSINVWSTVVSAGHTAQTYTCNHPASAFTNIDVNIFHGASGFDVAAVGNTASGANITSASFTPTLNASCISSGYIQAGQAMTPGTNYYQINTSSTNSFASSIRTGVPNSSQTGSLTHSNTAASMISVNCYKP